MNYTEDIKPTTLRRNWGWLMALGILLIILGIIALGATFLTTVFSTLFFGWLLLIGGIAQIIHSFQTRKDEAFFLHLLSGILSGFVGILLIFNPVEAALTITLLLAVFFVTSGLFSIIASLVVRFPNWGWTFFYGIITLLLGILIWRQWPVSGLWTIGLFIGLELIINGISWVMVSWSARSRTA